MITVYSSDWCPFCTNAKRLLDHKGVKYTEINVDNQPNKRAQMTELSGRTSVPQIFIGHTHVGGCDELYALERQGQLDTLISTQD
ncbi:glutaredoxin 3 [Neptunomonas japonica]|uniref:Glutaredoxin n=1 Tax=Neptunomonas japonica JAMM 1380 TaxID=1441457 RepID=A0A7R6SX80_9GAMM|nr:glutaredoxin 3 [Neptunomonas japonica]BBB31255.1 glutaredoxin 3 [Neptunomonas japonica JAMM 1380]